MTEFYNRQNFIKKLKYLTLPFENIYCIGNINFKKLWFKFSVIDAIIIWQLKFSNNKLLVKLTKKCCFTLKTFSGIIIQVLVVLEMSLLLYNGENKK